MTKSKTYTSAANPPKTDPGLSEADDRELAELFAFHDLARELCIKTAYLIHLVYRDKFEDSSFADHRVARRDDR